MKIDFFIFAGGINFIVAAIHAGIIFGGPRWYRFFGAGERMAELAEKGSPKPALITLAITLVLLIWSGYAFSAAGMLPQLPLLRPVLLTITCIYLARGLAGFFLPFFSTHPSVLQNSRAFWWWSSTISAMIGLVHLQGLLEHWPDL